MFINTNCIVKPNKRKETDFTEIKIGTLKICQKIGLSTKSIKNKYFRIVERAGGLKALVALKEDFGEIFKAHLASQNHL